MIYSMAKIQKGTDEKLSLHYTCVRHPIHFDFDASGYIKSIPSLPIAKKYVDLEKDVIGTCTNQRMALAKRQWPVDFG